MSGLPEPPQLLQIEIAIYKNLASVALPWSNGLGLYGPNGAGKTNLLECLALLMGTDRTLALMTGRMAVPGPGDLAVVAEMPATRLPLPPSTCFNEMLNGLTPDGPIAARCHREGNWWTALGVDAGDSFAEGLERGGVAAHVVEYLASIADRPLIRFQLDKFERVQPGWGSYQRQFSCQWVVREVPEWLRDHVDELPDIFGPLRSSLAAGSASAFTPLLELPPSPERPAELEWLSRARTSEEVSDDLLREFEGALPGTAALATEFETLELGRGGEEADPNWWLHEVAASAATTELSYVAEHLSIESRGEGNADWAIVAHTDRRDVARTGDEHLLESLSSGERRWVDEAFASAARAMARHGERCGWQASVWSDVAEADAYEVLPELLTEVVPEIKGMGFLNAPELTRMSQLFDQLLWRAGRQRLDTDRWRTEIWQSFIPGLRALSEPVRTIRVFDEPESHLHPSAQRRVSNALLRWSRGADDIVIATHSHYFLGHPDWAYVHVSRTPEGVVARPLTPGDLTAGGQVAAAMGLTRGELLAGRQLILVVEGEHDRTVLEGLFGVQLRTAGVGILALHGTHNAMALVDADFWVHFTDVPMALLFDNTRLERLNRGKRETLTEEEKKLVALRRALKRTGRTLTPFGLKRPDITAYLPESLLREDHPHFPEWQAVIREWERRGRPSFKSFVTERTGVDLKETRSVRRLVDVMRERGLEPHPELRERLSEIVALADAQRLVPTEHGA